MAHPSRDRIRIRNCYLEPSIKQFITTHVGHENMLFISSSGTGMTTLLHALLHDTPHGHAHFINPQEVNVQWIRKNFVPSIKAHTTKKQILLFDEIDLLLESSQHLLASILEEIPCIFYATCCDPHKIIPGIRSKCISIRLPPLSKPIMTRAIHAWFPECHQRKPTSEEITKLLEYAQGNLTRIRMGIQRLLDVDCLTTSFEGQSFIDQMYTHMHTFSHYPLEHQMNRLPEIQQSLHRYYEKNSPNLWREYTQSTRIKQTQQEISKKWASHSS